MESWQKFNKVSLNLSLSHLVKLTMLIFTEILKQADAKVSLSFNSTELKMPKKPSGQ